MGKYKFLGTPGPWRFEVNEKYKQVQLCGGILKYDLTVMDFKRWGMSGAAPRFNIELNSGLNIMERVENFAVTAKGREHHSDWFKEVNHPDANLIAAAPDLLQAAINFLEKVEDSSTIYHDDTYYQFKSAVYKALNIQE